MRKRKLFCKYGHDISVVGRRGSNCAQCYLQKYPKNRSQIRQFCFKGHDKDITGRTNDNHCLICIKEYRKVRARKQRKRKMNIMIEFKSKPCMDCHIQYPSYIMEFDHRNPEQKCFTIGEYAASGKNSIKKLLEEIDKCDVVCANCHRERTQQQILRNKELYENRSH